MANLDEQAINAALLRWRLVLGQAAQGALGGGGGGGMKMSGDDVERDKALSRLYDELGNGGGRDISNDRSGGAGESQMTTPDWINAVNRLFPKETIERLEKDAIERAGWNDVVTNPEVLERLEPSETLLQAVLRTKHLMNPQVLALARELVAKVVKQLMEKLARDVRSAFSGTIDRRKRSFLKVARNFDPKQTVKRNLAHYDPEEQKLYIRDPFFLSRTRKFNDKWQVIMLVDESGSMLGSVIHAAVTAACLWGLPSVKTHLCIFDTQVVDLTDDVTDPVETLMKVQLGGGTDIGKAVAYGADLVTNPRKSIVVLITDFFEGGDPSALISKVKALCDQGTIVLGLAALDEEANPSYDKTTAARLVEVGAQVGAMTPGQLANWIAEKVRT
ncbi:MAG: VWA domain-containing protein [Polyangiaceae bacterium]